MQGEPQKCMFWGRTFVDWWTASKAVPVAPTGVFTPGDTFPWSVGGNFRYSNQQAIRQVGCCSHDDVIFSLADALEAVLADLAKRGKDLQ